MDLVLSLLLQQTDLKRRQAIKVKRSPSNRSLNTSITTRIRRKAREAKEDIQGDAGHTAAYQEGGGQWQENLVKECQLIVIISGKSLEN